MKSSKRLIIFVLPSYPLRGLKLSSESFLPTKYPSTALLWHFERRYKFRRNLLLKLPQPIPTICRTKPCTSKPHRFNGFNRSAPLTPQDHTHGPASNTANSVYLKCGKCGHFRRECRSDSSVRDVIKNKLSYGTSAVNLIHEIIHNLEKEEVDEKDGTPQFEDLLPLDTLFVSRRNCLYCRSIAFYY